MCVDCGQQFRNPRDRENYRKYLLINSEFQVSLEYALKEEDKLIQNQLRSKKLVLILDLDNTLLHSTSFPTFVNSPKYYGRIDRERNIF